MYYVLFPGAYVPLTMEGTIMVDGVLASCYPFGYHDLAHFGMAPIRWFPTLAEKIFGNDNGVSAYAIMNEVLTKWLMPFGQQVK